MSDGRTVWWAKDSDWWSRERIVELGERFGAAGPGVADWLTCQAKKQNDAGQLRTGFRAVARGAFVTPDESREVVAAAVEIGLLDDFVGEGQTFRCRISGWSAEQHTAGSADRQRRYRDRLRAQGVEAGATGNVRAQVFERDGNRCLRCDAEHRLVADHVVPKSKGGSSEIDNLQTLCDSCNKDKGTSSDDYRPRRNVTSRETPEALRPPTGQDRTEQKKNSNNNAELRSAAVECFAYWQDRCNHKQASFSDDRRGKIEARLRERQRHHGGSLPAAIRDVRLAVDGAARAPFVDERGKRHDEIELICRNNSKLEDFMGRASTPLRVVGSGQRESPSDLWRAINSEEAS